MKFTCTCGEAMNLALRTVIYSGRVEIDNVPVFTCEACNRSEVYPPVKGDLTSLIEELAKDEGEASALRFDERNELALLMVKASDKDLLDESLTDMIDNRINELLDMMLLAKSLNNEEWMEDTRSKLRQITDHYGISGVAGKR